MYLIICYDIKKNKIRTKISRLLIEARGIRVQKSVFELEIKKKDFNELKEKFHKILKRKDSIAYYQLCENCIKKIVYSGAGEKPSKKRGKTVEVV